MSSNPFLVGEKQSFLSELWSFILAAASERISPRPHLKISGGGSVTVVDYTPVLEEFSRVRPEVMKAKQAYDRRRRHQPRCDLG